MCQFTKDASGNGPWHAIGTQNRSTRSVNLNIACSTMKSSKHKSNSVISKTKSALLEASPVFDGLTFKNNEGDIIDVKKTLAKNTRSAIDLLSHEANLRNTNDPVFNKLAGRRKPKPRKTLLPRFDPFLCRQTTHEQKKRKAK